MVPQTRSPSKYVRVILEAAKDYESHNLTYRHSQLALINSESVDVHVGPPGIHQQTFTLPVDLICYHSPVLRDLFFGQNRALITKSVTIGVYGSSKVEPFQMVVQWMVTGAVRIKNHPNGSILGYDGAVTISRYVSFVLFAYDLGLHISAAAAGVKSMMDFSVADLNLRQRTLSIINGIYTNHHLHDNILGSHIRSAADLPKGHPLRSFFADITAHHYIHVLLLDISASNAVGFKFTEELKDVRPYLDDLNEAVDRWEKSRRAHLN
jgi:hypothetical protein